MSLSQEVLISNSCTRMYKSSTIKQLEEKAAAGRPQSKKQLLVPYRRKRPKEITKEALTVNLMKHPTWMIAALDVTTAPVRWSDERWKWFCAITGFWVWGCGVGELIFSSWKYFWVMLSQRSYPKHPRELPWFRVARQAIHYIATLLYMLFIGWKGQVHTAENSKRLLGKRV